MLIRIAIVVLLGLSCTAAQDETAPDARQWRQIEKSDKISDFQDFIAKFPTSPLADRASRRIDELDWEKVDKKDADAVQEFIRKHPDMKVDAANPEGARQRVDSTPAPNAREQIVAVLEKLSKASQTLDAAQLTSIWPNAPRDFFRKIQKSANGSRNPRVLFRPVSDPHVEGDTAVVSCWRTVLTGTGDDEKPVETKMIIRLKHGNSGWTIEEIL